jgi:dTDP-4-dehydrorhamnose reductase
MKKKILVTGANGQLGKEFQVICALYPQFDFVFVARDDMPVDNYGLVRNTFLGIKPDYCVNCAAYTAVDKAESEKELAFLINGEAPGELAAICKEYNTRFVHISTDYVFDGRSSVPYKEDAPTHPESVYGASKLDGEQRVMLSNPGSIIIRTSWVYSEFGRNFVKTMLRLMNEKTEVNVVNDQFGSPTYAMDLAEVIMQIITYSKSFASNAGIYHYSDEGVITWYDFALAIKEISGSNCNVHPITTDQFPTVAVRPAFSVLDKTKIQETFGIKLKNWKESVGVCIEKLNSPA